MDLNGDGISVVSAALFGAGDGVAFGVVTLSGVFDFFFGVNSGRRAAAQIPTVAKKNSKNKDFRDPKIRDVRASKGGTNMTPAVYNYIYAVIPE